jgi:diketogulonate reductase-like aldo/keto reductase
MRLIVSAELRSAPHRPQYLEENAGAVDIKLSDDNVARLEAALRPDAVSGPRYNEKVMAWVDR